MNSFVFLLLHECQLLGCPHWGTVQPTVNATLAFTVRMYHFFLRSGGRYSSLYRPVSPDARYTQRAERARGKRHVGVGPAHRAPFQPPGQGRERERSRGRKGLGRRRSRLPLKLHGKEESCRAACSESPHHCRMRPAEKMRSPPRPILRRPATAGISTHPRAWSICHRSARIEPRTRQRASSPGRRRRRRGRRSFSAELAGHARKRASDRISRGGASIVRGADRISRPPVREAPLTWAAGTRRRRKRRGALRRPPRAAMESICARPRILARRLRLPAGAPTGPVMALARPPPRAPAVRDPGYASSGRCESTPSRRGQLRRREEGRRPQGEEEQAAPHRLPPLCPQPGEEARRWREGGVRRHVELHHLLDLRLAR
ncbi:unnamed protein product [Urochloa humidicola]